MVSDFLARVNKYVTSDIKGPSLRLPTWDEVEHEDEYNARCAEQEGFLHFDCKNVVFDGGRSKF